MGKFNYLLGKAKEIKIGDEVFKLRPLTARHMDVFMDVDKDSQAEMIFKIVTASLQQTDETIIIDDVKELPLPIFQEISEAVMEINELNK